MAITASSGMLQRAACKEFTARRVRGCISSKVVSLPRRAIAEERMEHHRQTQIMNNLKNGLQEEVLEEECACCGLSEECTPGYVARVKEMFCGRWVCGLCSEAVREEHRRLGTPPDGMEEALHAHMELCVQMRQQRPPPPSLILAGALRHVVRRHLQAAPTSPSSAHPTPSSTS